MRYSNKIKNLRTELNMSQREFAKLLRVAHGTIALWEIEKRMVPGPVRLIIDNFDKIYGQKLPKAK